MIASCYRKSKHTRLWMGRYARQVVEDIGMIDDRHALPRVLTSVALSRTGAYPQAAGAIDMGLGARRRRTPSSKSSAELPVRLCAHAQSGLRLDGASLGND
jgi:hypothetical protein